MKKEIGCTACILWILMGKWKIFITFARLKIIPVKWKKGEMQYGRREKISP
jgi:hypothetical protein